MISDEFKSILDEWQQEYSKRYGETQFELSTDSGIPLKPVYTPADIEGISYREIGMPGIYPYTRGAYPVQYQYQPPMAQHGAGCGLPEHTREIYDNYRRAQPLTSKGREPGYFVICDIATNHGLDPDDPLARGFVGVCGVTASTVNDFEILFKGLPLDRIHTVLSTYDASAAWLGMYIVCAEKFGYPVDQLHGLSINAIDHQIHCDHPSAAAKDTMKLIAEHIKFCTRNMPYWTPIRVSGYGFEESGANSIQELAFALALWIAITEECIVAGLKPDDFIPRLNIFLGFGNDFFEQIAKLRALRKMWAKITTERFGCKNPRSIRPIVAVQTAGSTFTAKQPMNNLLRAGFQTLAATLAGVNVIWTTPYDEAIGIHSEEAASLAFRTQQIILHETNISSVTDPLGGSYFLESLTAKLEEEATKLLEDIDRMGFEKAWETGWFRRETERSASEYRKKVESGEKTVVGVNKYVSDEKTKVMTIKADPKTEEIAIQRIKQFKTERDNAKTKAALSSLEELATKVREEWPKGGDLEPGVIEAVRAGATMGEITQIIKDAFDFHHRYY